MLVFKGKGKRFDDVDIPRLASKIGVGEDLMHAFMDTESLGSGFYADGSVKRLFEPHVFYRQLTPGPDRDKAVKLGIAYPKWRPGNYPKDSTSRILQAMEIDKEAAMRATSWGAFQVLGENFRMAGYQSAEAMVENMMDDEETHLNAAINFIIAAGIDDDMRRLEAITDRAVTAEECASIVSVYNGPGYRKNNYHTKFARSLNKWRKIPDTAWDGDMQAGDPPEMPAGPVTAPKQPKPFQPPTGASLKAVQQRLLALGYAEVGKPDGIWGTKTRAAVLAFRADNEMPLEPNIDESFMAALMMAQPREIAPERQNATVADLRDGGSRIIKAADNATGGATVLGGAAGVGVALQGLDVLGEHLTSAKGILDKIEPVKEALISAGPWVLGAMAIFIAWQLYKAKQARLDDHRTGKTATANHHSTIEVSR